MRPRNHKIFIFSFFCFFLYSCFSKSSSILNDISIETKDNRSFKSLSISNDMRVYDNSDYFIFIKNQKNEDIIEFIKNKTDLVKISVFDNKKLTHALKKEFDQINILDIDFFTDQRIQQVLDFIKLHEIIIDNVYFFVNRNNNRWGHKKNILRIDNDITLEKNLILLNFKKQSLIVFDLNYIYSERLLRNLTNFEIEKIIMIYNLKHIELIVGFSKLSFFIQYELDNNININLNRYLQLIQYNFDFLNNKHYEQFNEFTIIKF